MAAGGIVDGRGLASALVMGASGVWVGTRFMMTPESKTHPLYKEHLLRAKSDQTTVTKSYTGHSLRVLTNRWTKLHQNDPTQLEKMGAMQSIKAIKKGSWVLHSGSDEGKDAIRDGASGVLYKIKDIDYEQQAFVTDWTVHRFDRYLGACERYLSQHVRPSCSNHAKA